MVGAPSEDFGKVRNAGSVTVVYGSDTGFSGGSLLLTQGKLGGDNEKNDRFGEAVAIGDVNADGCKDVIIGIPGENKGAGRIQIVFGSDTGLDLSNRQSINQNTAGVPGKSEAGDEFGASIAVQGVGSKARLWVGTPRGGLRLEPRRGQRGSFQGR